MQTHTPLIVFKNVSKIYPLTKKRTVQAVIGVDLCIERGEFLVITGRSGSGKTTVLNLVAGLTQPTSGEVLLDGVEICRLPDAQQSLLRNAKIGFIFQFPSLMPSLTVLENVILPTIVREGNHRDRDQARALQLLEEVGLVDKLEAYPRQLSAGQQQRVVIARSLINQPELLLADEPTSNLDEKTEHEIMALIQKIHRERGITVLLVTHSSELISYGSRSLRMAGGEVVHG